MDGQPASQPDVCLNKSVSPRGSKLLLLNQLGFTESEFSLTGHAPAINHNDL